MYKRDKGLTPHRSNLRHQVQITIPFNHTMQFFSLAAGLQLLAATTVAAVAEPGLAGGSAQNVPCCRMPRGAFNYKTAVNLILCTKYDEFRPSLDRYVYYRCVDEKMERGVVRYDVQDNKFLMMMVNYSGRKHDLTLYASCVEKSTNKELDAVDGGLRCDHAESKRISERDMLPGFQHGSCDVLKGNKQIWLSSYTPSEHNVEMCKKQAL